MGHFAITASDILLLFRYWYWLLVFLTTLIIISTASPQFMRRLMIVLAVGILALAGIRLWEAIVLGHWGYDIHPVALSQNSYGIQFSTFAPYVLFLAVAIVSPWRWLSPVAMLILLGATAGNGSRSSWIAMSIALAVFILIYFLSASRRKGQLFLALMAITVLVTFVIYYPSPLCASTYQ